MKTALGYGATFVTGFAACALILYLGQGRTGASRPPSLPAGRRALSEALAQTPALGSARGSGGLPSIGESHLNLSIWLVEHWCHNMLIGENVSLGGEENSRARALKAPILSPKLTKKPLAGDALMPLDFNINHSRCDPPCRISDGRQPTRSACAPQSRCLR